MNSAALREGAQYPGEGLTVALHGHPGDTEHLAALLVIDAERSQGFSERRELIAHVRTSQYDKGNKLVCQ